MSNELDLAWAVIDRYAKIPMDYFGDSLLAVAVFGSLARGVAKFPGSDIDVMLILEGVDDLSFGKRIDLMKKVYEELEKTEEYRDFKEVFVYSQVFRSMY